MLQENDYKICSYHNHGNYDKCVILRHDIDQSLEKALEFALFENKLGVSSTYFILLSSNLYNIISAKNIGIIYKIKALGNEIGLHFDEMKYSNASTPILLSVEREIKVMSSILDFEITTVSMHRPSKETIAADYRFDTAINTYSKYFFENFKYLSDSRYNWREPVFDIVKGNKFRRLHILTHPFWYSKNTICVSDICKEFVNNANYERYNLMCDNIENFTEFMKIEEIVV